MAELKNIPDQNFCREQDAFQLRTILWKETGILIMHTLGLTILLSLTLFGRLEGSSHTDYEEQEGNIRRYCRPDLHSCFPSQLEWAKLDSRMGGILAWPDQVFNYTDYNFQYNLRTFTFPLVHAVVKSASDIQEVVKFARKHNLRLTIKSSGQDLWGRSSGHGSVCINLMEMKNIHVDTMAKTRSEYGEVKVETGVNFAELYQEVDKYDRVIVGGSGLKVSPGGYMAGGGHSPISPSLGLGVDSVLEIEVVLPDGRLATCTENKTVIQNDDGSTETHNEGSLFWALRGGGGGTFGVVVYYILKLHMAPASLVSVFITMPFYQNDSETNVATQFLDTYNSWVQNAPSHWGGYVYMNNYPMSGQINNISYHNTGLIYVILNKFGPWNTNTMSELEAFYNFSESIPHDMVNITVTNVTSLWDYLKEDPFHIEMVREYTLGALIPAEQHGTKLRDFLVNEFMGGSNGLVSCYFVRLGGKVMNYSENSSSVHPGFRKAQSWFVCSFSAAEAAKVLGWSTENDVDLSVFEEADRQEMKATEFATKLLNEYGVGMSVNEGFVPDQNWKLNFWGAQYPKLLETKVRYDPHNFFSCYHCVGSDHASWTDLFTSVSSTTTASFSVIFVLLTAILVM